MKLAIVTATIDGERAAGCIKSWYTWAVSRPALYIVEQGKEDQPWERAMVGPEYRVFRYQSKEILGVVPAFAVGLQRALEEGADVVACFHDDLQIDGPDYWDVHVSGLLRDDPAIGLVGFGGAQGLADEEIYRVPYNPMQLARKHFMSNMRHAEAHGERVENPRQIAVLDGFSQIGRREFWEGLPGRDHGQGGAARSTPGHNLFQILETAGVVHHAYDAALGAFAKQLGWEVWLLPVPCHHHGGLTAVSDRRYHEWAHSYSYEDDERPGGPRVGDAAFWEKSHRVVYEMFRGVLPIRV